MATVMVMEWKGVTQEQYDRIMDVLGLDENPPAGAMLHLAGPGERGWRVVDVWERAEDFERFVQERLMAAAQQVGMQGEPDVHLYPLYNAYAPSPDELVRTGASSLPGATVRA